MAEQQNPQRAALRRQIKITVIGNGFLVRRMDPGQEEYSFPELGLGGDARLNKDDPPTSVLEYVGDLVNGILGDKEET